LTTNSEETGFTKEILSVVNIFLVERNNWLLWLSLNLLDSFFSLTILCSTAIFLSFLLSFLFLLLSLLTLFFSFLLFLWDNSSLIFGKGIYSGDFTKRFMGFRKDGCNLEHLTSSFTIRCSDDRSVDVEETSLLEELMSSIGQVVSNSGD
jgi:hypothetical protein